MLRHVYSELIYPRARTNEEISTRKDVSTDLDANTYYVGATARIARGIILRDIRALCSDAVCHLALRLGVAPVPAQPVYRASGGARGDLAT